MKLGVGAANIDVGGVGLIVGVEEMFEDVDTADGRAAIGTFGIVPRGGGGVLKLGIVVANIGV